MNAIADPPLPFDGGRFPASDSELALVKRRILRLYILLPILAFAALLGGVELGIPALAALGVIVFGVTATAIGALAAFERRLMFIARSMVGEMRRYVIYEGLAAVPFGLAYVTVGLCAVAGAASFLLGTDLKVMGAAALARPSIALVPIGVFLAAHGIGFLIGFAAPDTSRGQRLWNGMMRLPTRLAGSILLAWGLAAFAIGLVDWLAPEAFRKAFQLAFGNTWPFHGP